jgi:hypothetical protein
MLGGIALFGLALMGYMQAPVWVVLPFALAGAAIRQFAARDPSLVRGWRMALRDLPLSLALTLAAYGLGWVLGAVG